MAKMFYVGKNFKPKSLEMIDVCNTIIDEYQAQGFDLTLRQLYYQCVARGIIPNNQREYDNLGSLLNDARLAGMVDWDAIVDRTRNLRERTRYENPQEIMEIAAKSFHTDRWEGQADRLECWIEKDALIGVIEGVCRQWDVPYFACRGYTSQSEMWAAGQRYLGWIDAENAQRPVILYLGDHDPSGLDMTRDIESRMDMFVGAGEVVVERLALNMAQVRQYNPPPNPTKFTDSRAQEYVQRYGRESWELDALDPNTIATLIRTAIRNHLNMGQWNRIKAREDDMREELDLISTNWREAVDFVGGSI